MENIRKIEAAKNNCGFYRRYCVLRSATPDYREFYAVEYAAKQELLDLCNKIDDAINGGIMSYVRIGYYLKEIRDQQLVGETDYKNIYDFAYFNCGISKRYTAYLINIAERFYIPELDVVGIRYTRVVQTSDQVKASESKNNHTDVLQTSAPVNGEQTAVDGDYHSLAGFSVSKLIELLPLSDELIVLYVKNPKMTVAELRQLVANLNYNRVDEEKKTEEQNARLDEEVKDIEAAYNPRQYYDFAYFKSKTKEQLLNIVMDLQRTYVENPKNF